MIRVLLADDQVLVRAGFKALLDAQADIEVVGEADGRPRWPSRWPRISPRTSSSWTSGCRRSTGWRRREGSCTNERARSSSDRDPDHVRRRRIRVRSAPGRGPAASSSRTRSRRCSSKACGRSPGATRSSRPASPGGSSVHSPAGRGHRAFPSGSTADRILATVMFSDIVSSTERAAEARGLALARRPRPPRRAGSQRDRRHGGREIKTTGDGFLALFDAPARAIRCAMAIRERAPSRGRRRPDRAPLR